VTPRKWIALVSLLGLFLGTYLTLYKFGLIGQLACNVSSCETVQTSRWSIFLGVPVATWGLGFYLGMLALSIAGIQERFEDSRQLSVVMLGMSAVGLAFTAWLNYLEAFVIHAWCEWCIASAVMVLALFSFAVVDFKRTAVVSEELLSAD
jgi:uncharacterized membrane protein